MAEINELGAMLGLLQQGYTPEQARAQMDEAKAMQMAKMTGREMTRMGLIQGGNALRQGLMSAMGADVQDPVAKMASQVRQLSTQFDLQTSQGWADYARALQSVNPQMAQQAALKSVDLRKKEAEIGKLTAETAKATSEGLTPDQKNAAALADSKGLDRGTKAWTDEYNKQLTRLTTKEGSGSAIQKLLTERGAYKPDSPEYKIYTDLINKERGLDVKPSEDFLRAAGSLKIPSKPFISSYTTEEIAKVDKLLAERALEKSRSAAPRVSVDVRGQEAFTTELGKIDAKAVQDARDARSNAAATINSLERLSTLTDEGLISGTFATGRVGATTLLDTLGLLSDKDKATLARSENYAKTAGDVVLGVLGGRLGAGFSNEDRKFILGLVPQLENSPQARRQLIDFMRKKNEDVISETLRLEDYARKNKGLTGFVPKIPVGAPKSAASSMSIDELAKAAGGKIVNGKFVKD